MIDRGFLCSSWQQDSPPISYVQVFRNGIIEAVDAYALAPRPQAPAKYPSPNTVEADVIKAFQQYCKLYSAENVEPPFVVAMTLIGVRDYSIYLDDRWEPLRRPNGFDRDIVVLPEVIDEDNGISAESALQPVFDSIWQAGGFLRSPNYGDLGNYRSRQ